jgi:hypothetical protein
VELPIIGGTAHEAALQVGLVRGSVRWKGPQSGAHGAVSEATGLADLMSDASSMESSTGLWNRAAGRGRADGGDM